MSHSSGPILQRIAQLSVLVAVMGCTAAFVSDGAREAVKQRASGKSINFAPNKAYQTECTSCHIGFLPGFLPERSWKKLMQDLENHFGENASIDEPVLGELLTYLKKNAADMPAASIRSKKIAKMIPLSESPIRITETPFWTRKHASIKAYVWKREKVGNKSHCDSCHRDAAKGLYTEHDVHIPR